MAAVAPYLGAFRHLAELAFDHLCFSPGTVVGWPAPSFQLRSLHTKSWTFSRSNDQPGPAEFEWLVGSSRDSLRHLHLDGYSDAVLPRLLTWGDKLETVHLTVMHWVDHNAVRRAVGVGRLKSLRRLTLAVGPEEEEDDYDDDDFSRFVAELKAAAAGVNAELGREVVVLEGV